MQLFAKKFIETSKHGSLGYELGLGLGLGLALTLTHSSLLTKVA